MNVQYSIVEYVTGSWQSALGKAEENRPGGFEDDYEMIVNWKVFYEYSII